METIKIKYFDNEIDKISKIDVGDWIDLRAAETVELKAGEYKLIPLGVGMILPHGYEAHIVPRSSTYKNFGVIQTNHCGIIDESYCGDNDQWRYPAFALRDTVIHKNDRICQFRIMKKQPEIQFEVVERLSDTDRGGFGSTGVATECSRRCSEMACDCARSYHNDCSPAMSAYNEAKDAIEC